MVIGHVKPTWLLLDLAKRQPKAVGWIAMRVDCSHQVCLGMRLRQGRVSQVPERGQREAMGAWLELNNDMEPASSRAGQGKRRE